MLSASNPFQEVSFTKQDQRKEHIESDTMAGNIVTRKQHITFSQ